MISLRATRLYNERMINPNHLRDLVRRFADDVSRDMQEAIDVDPTAFDAERLAEMRMDIETLKTVTTLKEIGSICQDHAWDFESFTAALAYNETDAECKAILLKDDGWSDEAINLLWQHYGMFVDEGDTREWAAEFDT